MLLQIDGWYGGGKSVLLGLLDGHPDISPNPLHDATHMAALLDKAVVSCSYHDIEEIRRLIGFTQYYVIEKHSREGTGMVNFGAGILINPKFDFKFYEFDQAWIAKLQKHEVWTPELIIDTIYKNYAFYLTGKSDWKYNLTMSWPLQDLQANFVQNFKNGKSIFVERSVEHIIAVRSGREKIKDSNDSFFAPGFDKLINEGEVGKILTYNRFIADMVNRYPKQFLSVQLDSLIHNRETVMPQIAQFLEIPFHESLLKWTFLGEEVKHNGKSYVDELNDTPESILTATQRKTIANEIKKFNSSYKIPSFPSLIRKTGTVLHLLANKLEK